MSSVTTREKQNFNSATAPLFVRLLPSWISWTVIDRAFTVCIFLCKFEINASHLLLHNPYVDPVPCPQKYSIRGLAINLKQALYCI